MTVKELIAKLRKYNEDEDKDVVFSIENTDYTEISIHRLNDWIVIDLQQDD